MTSDGFRERAYARALAYPVMIAGAVGFFLLVRSIGSTLIAPAPAVAVAAAGAASAKPDGVLFHLLLAIVVIIIAARVCGALCKRIHQPPVIGEVIAGILLGPCARARRGIGDALRAPVLP